MTRDECRSLKAGMRCLIGDSFVEDDCYEIEKYLNTVQTVERVDSNGTGWIYFKDLPQPFAFSEVICVHDMPTIDDESVPYEHGDFGLIFGEVAS